MKGPINPSEPLFPVRMNEPVCQYYMKHGTCKFSQSCKFNHPPQSSLQTTSLVGSNSIFIPRASEPQHIILNAAGQDQGSSTMMLQFLPQRPDEPDCLYYLRNGTCKYGATCRYHHPVNHHQQRKSMEMQRRQQQQVAHLPAHVSGDGTVQYVQSQQSYQQQSSRVVSTSGGQHVLVTETPIQVMSVNNGGYQQISVDEYSAGVPIGMSQHHVSSSSMASSYETASSTLEYISQGQGNWDRPKRTNSGGSLSAFADAQQARQQSVHGSNRVVLTQGGNDNSMNSRRLRTASFGSMGSTSDQSAYHDSMGWSGGNGSQGCLPVHQERYVEGGHAFEQPRRQQYYRGDGYENRQSLRDELPQQPHEQLRTSVPRQGPPRQSRSGNVDQGLSMMTSALLNMLDTPEDAAARSYDSRISSSSTLNNSTSPPVTPRSGNMHSEQHNSLPPLNERHMPLSSSSTNMYQQDVRHQVVYTTQMSTENSVRAETTRSSPYAPVSSKHQDPAYGNGAMHFQHGDPTSVHGQWSPSWQESAGQPPGQRLQDKAVQQHRAPNEPPSPHTNVGLYLP